MKITGNTAAEIFERIRLLVRSGQLQPGELLPPVRELAINLDVNRNTVAAAYKRLVAAGIAATQGRLGTVIRGDEVLGEQEGTPHATPLIDLAGGNPNPDWLPDPAAALASQRRPPRLYGAPLMNPELEAYGRAWLSPDCPAGPAIDLTHGAVDAVERLLAAYLAPGDRVAVEDPCFLSSINTLRTAGFEAIGVPIDGQGMRADALEAALEQGAQAVIITPRAHNPTGCSLGASRAKALRAVLARHPHALVIVDDHFALLAQAPYHDVIPKNAQRWALVRSLSKALGPDLRLAFVASDAQTSNRLRLRLAGGTSWVSHILQDIAQACLLDSRNRQIKGAREDYARRRQQLAEALRGENIATAPADGLNLWLPLATDGGRIAGDLARQGWLVRAGEAFGVGAPARGLRVTISALTPEQARRFAADLRGALTRAG
ncbi:transcriptional regulator PtsJ [Pseudoxanthomonas sp. z9]|uniref:MocR-like B6 salvage transcription factor PtsJ n=1 Tax=Pseudoxanthomonas sp. z9 TaxID=2584942 RepID=UPI00114282F5|nr:transcriptional regulator PtsJ [Pseudoxanthomonas sp. z9]